MSWEYQTYQQKGYSPAVGPYDLGKNSNYDLLEEGDYTGTVNDQVSDLQTERQLRLGFIRKVYSILSVQLILTMAISALCVLNDTVREFILHNIWTVYVGMALSIVSLLCLYIVRDKYPTNMFLLVFWTLVEAYTVGVVCAAYFTVGQGTVVMQAAGLTLAVFLALTIATFQMKIDFSFLGGALFASLWVLLLWGMVIMIFGFKHSYLYSLLGAVVFALYILYDTSVLINKLGPDEYIVACIDLYLDILNLFLFILKLMTKDN